MLLVLALLGLIAQGDGAAATDMGKARAQELLNEGTTAYESGDFATALRRFNAAYALYPSPKLWLNIGQALRDLDRPGEAMDAFERFIDGVDDPPPDVLAEARRSVTELVKQLNGLALDCPVSGAMVMLDGVPVGRTPLVRKLWLTPGRHGVRIERQGYLPFSITLHAVSGQTTRFPVRLQVLTRPTIPSTPAPIAIEPKERPPRADSLSTPLYLRWPVWAVVGGAILAGGIALAVTTSHGAVPPTRLGAQDAFR
jgi:hypothetical protein